MKPESQISADDLQMEMLVRNAFVVAMVGSAVFLVACLAALF